MTERIHKVKSHYGMTDYYKNYKKTCKNPVDKKTYNAILTEIFTKMGEHVVNNNYTLRFPYNLGSVMILKRTTTTKFDDEGNIITNRPVNYRATLDLWEANPKAKEDKIRIYHENYHSDGYVFFLKYLKKSAIYRNRYVYNMQFARRIKRQLAQNIFQNKIDALTL